MKQVKGMAAAKVGTARWGVVTGWRKDGLHGDRRGLVAEVSMLALAASGALFSASPATAQVTPAAPECTIVGQTVTCQGNLSAGVTVTPQDTYDTLMIDNLTADITGMVSNGAAVSFVNSSSPVTIATGASNFAIHATPVPQGTGSRSFGILAGTTGDIRIDNNLDITSDATGYVLGGVYLTRVNAIRVEVARMSTPSGTPPAIRSRPVVEIANNGRLEVIGASDISNSIDGIEVVSGSFSTRDFLGGSVSVVNGPDGYILLRPSERNFLSTGIVVGDPSGLAGFDSSQDIYVRNSGIIDLHSAGSRSLQGIRVTKQFSSGIDEIAPMTIVNEGNIVFHRLNPADPFADGPAIGIEAEWYGGESTEGEIRIVNSGLIDVDFKGIEVIADVNMDVTNSGTIRVAGGGNNSAGVLLNFPAANSPSFDKEKRFENTETGVITAGSHTGLYGTGVIAYIGNPVIINRGEIGGMGTDPDGLRSAAGIAAATSTQLGCAGPTCSLGPIGHVTIENYGKVWAEGTNAASVIVRRLYGTDAHAFDTDLLNSGDISGVGEDADGIRIVHEARESADEAIALLGNASITLTQSSVVSGGSGDGAAIRIVGGGRHTIDNVGYTTAESGFAIVTGAGSETVVNSGEIDGTVSLGGGADTMELVAVAGQSVTGLIDGQGGTDHFRFSGAGTASFGMGNVTGFETFEKTGASTWTLTGSNAGTATFAHDQGTLVLNATLQNMAMTVAGDATLGGTGTLGSLTVANNGILAPGNSIGTLTVTGNVVLNDTSRLNYELGAPGTGGTPGSSDLLAVGGNLTLDGKLHLTDAGGAGIGHYRLMTYGGTLTDNTLDVMTPHPVASATYTIQSGGGNVDLVIASTGPVIGDPNLQYWQDNSATWTVAGTDWRNSGGDIDVAWAGNHGVFNGTGSTISADGSQSFKGLQFVTSDYTLAGPGTLQTVAGGSELRVLGGETATIAATIAGSGGISKTEAGTLTLTGANTYTGATTIEAGALALQGTGSIASSSALGFTGASLFDVSGVAAGNTQIGTLSGVAGSKIVLGATDLTINHAANGTFAGVVEGTGGVEKSGIGILTLTGDNTYTGTTTIAQGTLSLGDGGTSGSVAGNIVNNNALLAFNRSDDVTYAGILSGSGATSFIGSGMTTLTGNSGGLTGPVAVTAGNLRLASGASLGATMLTVGTGGTLSGLGTVAGNLSIEGRLAPGITDTLGTFNVTGKATFVPGSTYAIHIAGTDPLPSGQTVDSLSVDGTADLTGGAVEIAAIDPRTSYVDGHRYATPILSATGGLGGTEFADAGMASGSAFITPTLSYEGNDVFLTIAVTQDFTTAAGTFNQLQAANALNGLEQTGDALTVFNTIANMDEDNARRAFDLTSGEVHAAGQHVIDQTFALFNRTLRYQGVAGIGSGNVGAQVFTAPLGYGPAVTASSAGVAAIDDATDYADARVRGAWAAPLGGFGHVDADGNAAKLDWWNAGLAGGYEGVIDVASGKAVGGFGFGYIHSRGTVDARLSTFDSDGFYLGAYGAWADGPWNVAGSLSYGANRVSTTRNIAFMGTTAGANYWTHTIGLSGEASYAFDLANTTKLAPLFTLDAGWSGHGGFTETGAGALNLTSGSESWTRLDAGLGIALTHIILTETGKVTLEGRAVWEHAFSDVVPSQNLAFAGSPTGFTVLGPDAGRDRLRIGAGLSWDVSDDMTVRARYDGLFSGNQANHSASLGLNIRF